MSKPFRSLILSCCCLAVATAAAQTQPTVQAIGARKVEALTVRHPASCCVVVFEAGSRGTIDKWAGVLAAASRDATVFAYNRPGYGNSDIATTPRDGRTIVEELRQLLRHQGLRPPYVLVGHSLGGLYMQLFARAYPDEVKGVVLVDALYPGAIRPVADFPWTTRLAGRLLFSRTAWSEIEQIDATGREVLALPDIDNLPIVRLVNRPKAHPGKVPPIAVDFGVTTTDKETIERMRRLYPNAKTVMVDSDHQMQQATPEAVVQAIRDVLHLSPELLASARK
ncbi:alpha/beta fold hydrolase [Massilia sp. YMA4]|uniref:alpha/beta fold hydrolase n=1 Tax=Massilia sp. YMA4 TaxID=1593482 RepID=UPI000DD11440|nr:alpha/beta fold hydrolase [Massilia sp. YMA4]AXA92720.1 alpha/beta hydrolase [Massilia sp. YMA4]